MMLVGISEYTIDKMSAVYEGWGVSYYHENLDLFHPYFTDVTSYHSSFELASIVFQLSLSEP